MPAEPAPPSGRAPNKSTEPAAPAIADYHTSVGPAQIEAEPRVLKQGDTFAVFNPYGDINSFQSGEDGLFHRDTRHLSHFELQFGTGRPLLLRSMVRRDNTVLTVDLTNPDFGIPGNRPTPRDQIHIARRRFLWQGTCFERVKLHNYGADPAEFGLLFTYDADFVDIFEVRGQRRARRGVRRKTRVHGRDVSLSYRGLDGVVRSTRLSFAPPPHRLSPTSAHYAVALEPGATTCIYIAVACETDDEGCRLEEMARCLRRAKRAQRGRGAGSAVITTSNELFNDWITRSTADLHMLVSDTPHGPYPFAGIPWFSTAFGRDGIITALLCLWAAPRIARGVLSYLSATQAIESNPAQEAEPGKILHETRQGEMAATGEVPFGCYYGSVDATPLFVLLAGAYLERTGDLAYIRRIWPSIESALGWIDRFGDLDGDGFVEYAQRTPTGLVNQGWKDSADSVFHADGTLAQGPIALCEVQAYVYQAKLKAAAMATALGNMVQAETLSVEAALLQERFEEVFWCDGLSSYALALDGDKRPCRVRSSNPGHALFAQIPSAERAGRTARTLMSPGSFSGWGIRTLDAVETRYNPMSYHNGSVWPHDNALIALGFARYGFKDEAQKVLAGLFDASLYMELRRLPELLCGFVRHPSEGPITYPTACSPQAWASVAASGALAACLGVAFDAAQRQIRFHRPTLPAFLEEVRLDGLTMGDGVVDLVFRRHAHDVAMHVARREGEVDVLVTS